MWRTGNLPRDNPEVWAAAVRCRRDIGAPQVTYFPDHRHDPEVDARWRVHSTIAGASNYCVIIDDDWDRIVDLYHRDPRDPRESAEQL